MVSYYRVLWDLSDKIKTNLRGCPQGSKEYSTWFECQKVLETVIHYVLNESRPPLRDKIQAYWRAGCDYIKTVESGEVDVNYEGIRVCIARTSRKLYEKLGYNIISFLESGKPTDAHIEFMVKTNQLVLDDVFPKGVVDMLPNGTYSPVIDLKDCMTELGILKSLTYMSLKSKVDTIDPVKLSHILAILGGSGGTDAMTVRKAVWGYIFGKDDLKAMLNDLKVKNLID